MNPTFNIIIIIKKLDYYKIIIDLKYNCKIEKKILFSIGKCKSIKVRRTRKLNLIIKKKKLINGQQIDKMKASSTEIKNIYIYKWRHSQLESKAGKPSRALHYILLLFLCPLLTLSGPQERVFASPPLYIHPHTSLSSFPCIYHNFTWNHSQKQTIHGRFTEN